MEAVATKTEAPKTDKAIKGKTKTDNAEPTVPQRLVRECLTVNNAGEDSLTPIGRIVQVFCASSNKPESREKLRFALKAILDGACQQRLVGGHTMETVLTTSAGTYRARALKILGE